MLKSEDLIGSGRSPSARYLESYDAPVKGAKFGLLIDLDPTPNLARSLLFYRRRIGPFRYPWIVAC